MARDNRESSGSHIILGWEGLAGRRITVTNARMHSNLAASFNRP